MNTALSGKTELIEFHVLVKIVLMIKICPSLRRIKNLIRQLILQIIITRDIF